MVLIIPKLKLVDHKGIFSIRNNNNYSLMNTELEILKIVTMRLDKLKIPYMLTGSMALLYYTTPRMTRDIDIVIQLQEFMIDRFIKEFHNDFYLSEESIKDAVKKKFIFNLINYESSMKIDFIVKKDSLYRETEFDRKVKIKINDFEIYSVSKEDLILSKLEWIKKSFSAIQIEDIKNLLESGYEKKYLENWVSELNLHKELELVQNA